MFNLTAKYKINHKPQMQFIVTDITVFASISNEKVHRYIWQQSSVKIVEQRNN